MGIRIGIDTGGTFTDIVALDEITGALVTTKTPSTPSNPADGFMNGIAKILDLMGRSATDISAVSHGTIVFIAVGTPAAEDGSANLQHVLAVAQTIGEHMNDYKLVVNKSTVPVGTADRVRSTIAAGLRQRAAVLPFAVVSNPEFLKEGVAIDDFMRPDRVIVGCDNDQAALLMRALYAPFLRNRDRLMMMDVRSAELTKYVANAMLATRISFMNEMALLWRS